ncbi:MAG: hypothetical protein D6702_08515 [Planctomycetota bacterium]|nr:MAG: hypothetical protein D6702_08515 [Planctomycetota bacterium]
MSRTPVRAAALAAVLLAACGGDDGGEAPGPTRAPAGNGRPVILISIDSLRADHCTPYGHRPQFAPEEQTTPFLARLAAEGVLWENAAAPTSWTLPSHLSLLTGMDPIELGVSVQALRPKVGTETVASPFQAAGYATAGFFSAPYLHPIWGFGEGFDHYVGAARYLNEDSSAEAILSPERGSMNVLFQASDSDAETAVDVVDHALAWLEEGERWRRPFFLFLHFWDPHYDYRPPPELAERFHPGWDGIDGRDVYVNWRDKGVEYTPEEVDHFRALYDAEIRYTDDQIARLFAQLEEWGRADDLILAVVSDHGDEFFEHGGFGHHKTLYEEVVHVPMVLRAPGLVPAGRRLQGTAPTYALASTLLDLAGLQAWPDRAGRSLRPMWEEEDRDQVVLYRLDHPGRRTFLKGWRLGPDKIQYRYRPARQQAWAWFDLSSDRAEREPRILERPAADGPSAAAAAAIAAADGRLRPTIEVASLGADPALLEEIQRDLASQGYTGDGD